MRCQVMQWRAVGCGLWADTVVVCCSGRVVWQALVGVQVAPGGLGLCRGLEDDEV